MSARARITTRSRAAAHPRHTPRARPAAGDGARRPRLGRRGLDARHAGVREVLPGHRLPRRAERLGGWRAAGRPAYQRRRGDVGAAAPGHPQLRPARRADVERHPRLGGRQRRRLQRLRLGDPRHDRRPDLGPTGGAAVHRRAEGPLLRQLHRGLGGRLELAHHPHLHGRLRVDGVARGRPRWRGRRGLQRRGLRRRATRLGRRRGLLPAAAGQLVGERLRHVQRRGELELLPAGPDGDRRPVQRRRRLPAGRTLGGRRGHDQGLRRARDDLVQHQRRGHVDATVAAARLRHARGRPLRLGHHGLGGRPRTPSSSPRTVARRGSARTRTVTTANSQASMRSTRPPPGPPRSGTRSSVAEAPRRRRTPVPCRRLRYRAA